MLLCYCVVCIGAWCGVQGKWKGNEEVLTAFGPSSSNSNSNVVATEMLPQSNTVPSPAAAKGETAFVMSDAEVSVLVYN